MPQRLAHIVMIVDDDNLDAARIARGLHAADPELRLEVARDGKEALVALESLPKNVVPIILLDLNMPRMGGIDFLDTIRAHDDLKRAIVFVLTTSDDPTDRAEAYDRQVAGYFLKTNDLSNLARLLHQYISVVRLA